MISLFVLKEQKNKSNLRKKIWVGKIWFISIAYKLIKQASKLLNKRL